MVEESRIAEQIVENLPVGVIVVDGEMHVVHMNPAAETLTGYSLADVGGKRLLELFGPEIWSEESPLRQAMETSEPVEPRVTPVTRVIESRSLEECRPSDEAHRDEGLRRCLLVGAAPLGGRLSHRIDSGHPRSYLLTLDAAGPLYQIGSARIADIAHDMRGPLASIRAYTELLVDEVDQGDPELRRQFLDVIDHRTRHLTSLIINLVGLIRQDIGCLEFTKAPVSLLDVVRGALAACQLHARQQDVRLLLDAADDRHLVVGDHDALSTLLTNVISNAITFSPTGGDVVIALRRVGQDQVVGVTDGGEGVHPEDLPHVFEAFYRGRNAVAAGVEGSGLGLTLARVIAEAHGGQIEVESHEGEGTSVTITLPTGEGSPPLS